MLVLIIIIKSFMKYLPVAHYKKLQTEEKTHTIKV